MHSSHDCGTAPSLFLWSRDARPVRLVWTAPRRPIAMGEPANADPWGVDDLMFGISAAALLFAPLSIALIG